MIQDKVSVHEKKEASEEAQTNNNNIFKNKGLENRSQGILQNDNGLLKGKLKSIKMESVDKLRFEEIERFLIDELAKDSLANGNGSFKDMDSLLAVINENNLRIEYKQGEINVSFHIQNFTPKMLEGILKIGKRFMPSIRIRSWSQEDYRFQALNENIYQTEGLAENLFFSIQGVLGFWSFLVKRKAYFLREDVYFLAEVFRLVNNVRDKIKPEDLLESLGVVVYKTNENLTWDTLSGYERVKREVTESVILPFQHQGVYDEINSLTRVNNSARRTKGGNRPRAILFNGPPGVGKTTMAKLIAHEVGVPLIYIPIESIISKYYGQSSKNLSTIFDLAATFDRAIIFLDEIDSLAGSRDAQMFEATRRVLSVLLRYVDGFESKKNILTIGATNRSEDLDRALISRFDHTVQFDLPDENERRAILKSYAGQLSVSDLEKIAKLTENYSGRNLKDLCDYAERWWARHIILQKLTVSAPSLEAYLKAFDTRKLITHGHKGI